MENATSKKLAASLTAETTELLPFLPYLLQDFWALGSEPSVMADLLEKHLPSPRDARVLDLACGKGAVSVKIARRLGAKVKGIDIMPDFLRTAAQKAAEHGVETLCEFSEGDINEAVTREQGYDAVILGAAGDVLGSPAETLHKLKATIKSGGLILIDDCYLPDGAGNVLYEHYEYLTKTQWHNLFAQAGLEPAETANLAGLSENLDSEAGMAAITKRAGELIEKYPARQAIFEGYIRSQRNEYADIDNTLVCVTWVLRFFDNDK